MMKDYEYLFATTLHAKIKDEIIGRVYVTVVDDEIRINIESSNGIKYVYTQDGFAERFRNGWTTEYAAFEVLREYRKYIIKKYFK